MKAKKRIAIAEYLECIKNDVSNVSEIKINKIIVFLSTIIFINED